MNGGLAVAFLFGALLASAAPPPGYYAAAEGKTGTALRQALHNIIRNHYVLPYASSAFDTSDALRILDQDPVNANNVIGIYSRESEPKTSFGLTTGWNREHLWANSYGIDSREPAYSDLQNLRAEDEDVNSARANKLFDISDTNDPGFRFPAHSEAPLASTDSDSWEPPASVKGDIARALFYMTVRYTGDAANEPRLTLTDALSQITGTTNFMGKFGTLLKWHQGDPVDAAERLRNDLVYSYQTNRNPFVDRPEFVVAAFIPSLNIRRAGDRISLVWTNDYAPSLSIEESAASSFSWVTLTNSPALTSSNNWLITLPLQAGERMFRLRVQ